MKANILKPFKIGKETFHPQSFNESEFVMNYKLEPKGMVPPHAHLYMDEYFFVSKGVMTFKVNGETIIKKAGEEITVPKGVKHSIANKGNEEVEMTVKYMPCSDTDRFFEMISVLDTVKPASVKTLMQALYISDKLNLRQFSHPQPMFANNIIMTIIKIVGNFSGWNKLVKDFR